MEDFKKLPKMQCFKTGGKVEAKAMCYGGKMKEGGEVDIAQDKKVVKKAFAMHDKQEHPGEKTDLSKLKKGGRTKKAVGTVKKFACGGGVFGAKKTKEDIKNMDAAKECKPKKLAMGGQAGATEAQQKFYDKNKANAKVKEDKAMYEAVGSRGDAARKGMEEGRMDAMGTAYKKGGNVKKCAEGGSLKAVDAEENPGLAKLPTNVRNKMGYMRKGGKAKKMNTGGMSGPVSPVAQEIIEGKRPPQTAPGQMTPDERRASVAKAFGAGTKKMKTGGTCS